MKRVALIGSTGSIGQQTLQVIGENLDKFAVVSLVAYSNSTLLFQQAKQFNAPYFATIAEKGQQCLIQAVKNCDIAVIATRGIVALDCVMYCLENNIDVAIANKEVLVCAGALILQKLQHSNSKLLPVDSEHSAIFQCLAEKINKPKKLILTASGGAFWDFSIEQLQNVTVQQALKHPNWSMGEKITIDSATMMNKTFEVLEAACLFGMQVSEIEIVVHRQSIVHSLVQFADNSVLAQLSNPDMKLPIQYALTYPKRFQCNTKPLNFSEMPSLTFEKCDFSKFPCAKLAYEIQGKHKLLPTVLNASNDICVQWFLLGKLKFTEFYEVLTSVLQHFQKQLGDDVAFELETIKQIDTEARNFTKKYLTER